MPDDSVIDIRQYLTRSERDQGPGAFAVWGGGGERARFALPLWRAIYLAKGDWGGIVSVPTQEPEYTPQPLFILDLLQDPARRECPAESLRVLKAQSAPAMARTRGGGVAVLLGVDEQRRWYLQVQGAGGVSLPEGTDRETFLFLAGECAGLLFFRELATPFPSSSSAP